MFYPKLGVGRVGERTGYLGPKVAESINVVGFSPTTRATEWGEEG